MTRQYIGDAVYAEFDERGDLVLTTSDGTPYPTNRIVLEPAVWDALCLFMQTLNARMGR